MGEAVRLEPGAPPYVAGVSVDLVAAVLAEPRHERRQRVRGVVAGIEEQERPAALPDSGIAGHATVTFDDHPRRIGADELVASSPDTGGAPDQAATSASASAMREGPSAGVAGRSIVGLSGVQYRL